MQATERKGGIRSNSVFEGEYQETYAAVAGPIRSPKSGKVISRVKFMPKATEAITWRDKHGNQNTATLNAGQPYPFYVSEISAAASGVIIIHDNEEDPSFA